MTYPEGINTILWLLVGALSVWAGMAIAEAVASRDVRSNRAYQDGYQDGYEAGNEGH